MTQPIKQSKQPLVSVIVPCYNQGEFLFEAIESLKAQTYSNWECVIVNDGSSDNTEAVAKQCASTDNRVKYILQANQGVSTARNNAISNSTGKYILPLDADDKIAPTYLEKAVFYLEEHPEVKLFYSKVELFGQQLGVWNLPEYAYDTILWQNVIVCTAMYRRSDYDKTQGYNPNMRDGLEDWDFWLSFLHENDRVYQTSEVLFFYRIKKKSRNADITYSRNRRLNRQIVQNHMEIYLQYLPEIINYHEAENQLNEAVAQKASEIRESKAYRLGKFLLKPFRWMKRACSK